MKLVKTIKEVREEVKQWKKEGKTIGFVPTMGYLHDGHMSLVDKSVSQNDRTVVSVFVNPTQFGPGEDLESYPRDIEHDAKLCEEHGAALVFNPEPEEMYDEMFCTYVEMSGLTEELCAKTRPTHFRGVCTVVSKLFNIVTPDRAYFGEKDAQQLAVIRRMVKDLSMDIEIVGCPIVREEDGLAKSSRNTYLNEKERAAATVLSRSLRIGKRLVECGERSCGAVEAAIRAEVEREPLAKVDYVKIVDAETMKPVKKIDRPVLVAEAVYIGKTRLIDNFSFTEEKQ